MNRLFLNVLTGLSIMVLIWAGIDLDAEMYMQASLEFVAGCIMLTAIDDLRDVSCK